MRKTFAVIIACLWSTNLIAADFRNRGAGVMSCGSWTQAASNIGMNNGDTAGQTVGHAHVHLIPRRLGDVKDPRGGVRGVIPGKASY
jgi:hypothetical protein